MVKAWKKNNRFLTGPLPRKKIDGAIAVCQQDPLRLIRTDTTEFGSFFPTCPSLFGYQPAWRLMELHMYRGYLKDCSWPVCKHAQNIIPTSLNKSQTLHLPCRTCQYGGEEEYHVNIRESGSLEQGKIKQSIRKQIEKDCFIMTDPFAPNVPQPSDEIQVAIHRPQQ